MTDYSYDKLVKNSSIYQEFLAEREEILKHKWLRSEEQGRDIGFDAALVDWTMNYRTTWKKKRSSGKSGSRRSSGPSQ